MILSRALRFTVVSSLGVRSCCIALPLRDIKPKSQTGRASHFVDWKRVKVIGGTGGDGCISFLQLFCNPNAGPDGGDGGNGGHVIFEASDKVKSLDHVASTVYGEGGMRGLGKEMHGKSGCHTTVLVPLGTVVRDNRQTLLADLDMEGMQFLAARGGAGGRGNRFYLSNTNRHPRLCQLGAQGEALVYHLEMKTMAHVGLVGFPNAGKSTLLQGISRARPKVASYPFTTLRPHVGIVHYNDHEQIAVADLPGLIEGAHLNRGLGISFLRHAERCICLLFVVDLSSEDPAQQLRILLSELEHYRENFTQGPHMVVANKVDLCGPEDSRMAALKEQAGNLPVVAVSAKLGTNLLSLLLHIRKSYDAYSRHRLQW